MEIKIPYEAWDADIYTLTGRALRMGAHMHDDDAGTVYCITKEHLITQLEIDMILSKPALIIDQSVMYIELPFTTMDNLVDVDMPNSKRVDENGVEVRRTLSEYAPFHTVSVDGTTVMLRCVHVPYGSTVGQGLDNAELRLWESQYGIANGGLIGEQDAKIKLASATYVPAAA